MYLKFDINHNFFFFYIIYFTILFRFNQNLFLHFIFKITLINFFYYLFTFY